MAAILATDNVQVCLHMDLEYLGNDGPTSFQRCRTCESVVIGQGSQTWILRPRAA